MKDNYSNCIPERIIDVTPKECHLEDHIFPEKPCSKPLYNKVPPHEDKPLIKPPYDPPIAKNIPPHHINHPHPTPIPNPMPHTYIHPCPPPPPIPPHHIHCDDPEHTFVTIHQLNNIIQNIADADIFKDLSTNGTTVSVGGIPKGTKFSRVTFSQLIEKMLYPKNIPETLDIYPNNLNNEVKYDIGGFKAGDSLKGMTIVQILEKLLCGQNDDWGSYIWKSDLYDLSSGETEIDAELFCPNLITEYTFAQSTEDFLMDDEGRYRYELYAVCATSDRDNEDGWRYDCLIKMDGSDQITNPTLPPDVSEDLSWEFNPVTRKIEILNGAITTNMCLIMIRRS